MKIALHYSGMIRTLKYCYPKVMKALKDYEVHIFMSIWDIPGHSLKYKKDPVMAYPDLEYENITEDFIRSEFPDLDIKIINIEKYETSKKIMKDFSKNNGNLIEYKKEIISHYYKVQKVNKLRKQYEKRTGIKYDWYMKLRPDVSIEKMLDLSQYKTPILFLNKYIWEDPNYITLTKLAHQKGTNQINENAACCFWITNNEEIMDLMCNLIDDISNFWDNEMYGERVQGLYIRRSSFNGEKLMKFITLYNFKVKILRSHGYSQNHGERRTWE